MVSKCLEEAIVDVGWTCRARGNTIYSLDPVHSSKIPRYALQQSSEGYNIKVGLQYLCPILKSK